MQERAITEARADEGSPQQAAPFTRHGLLRGARRGLPLAASGSTYSLVFGALAHTAGLHLAETALMSSTVVAGAAQFVVIGLWTTPPVLASVLTATLLVNLRHLLLGATLRPWFARSSRLQTYGSAFFLFDETWALTHREAESGAQDRGFLLGCGLTLWSTWVVGGVLGYLAAGHPPQWVGVPDPTRWGLDFAATAVFVALLAGMWRGKGNLRCPGSSRRRWRSARRTGCRGSGTSSSAGWLGVSWGCFVMRSEVVLTIAGMALVTYLTRAGGFWLGPTCPNRRASRPGCGRFLGALLVALVAPACVAAGPAGLLAAGAAVADRPCRTNTRPLAMVAAAVALGADIARAFRAVGTIGLATIRTVGKKERGNR